MFINRRFTLLIPPEGVSKAEFKRAGADMARAIRLRLKAAAGQACPGKTRTIRLGSGGRFFSSNARESEP
jgi:hypothetical protein